MNLRREARWLWPIAGIIIVALVCGAYILTKQRLTSPIADRYTLEMEFQQADAVSAGLGQPVTVAGVAVGQIETVKLENGLAVTKVSMNPEKLPKVYADATAALIPNTPLKDMQIRLYPGDDKAHPLEENGRIAVAATTIPVDSDQLLRALDADTRTWVNVLVADLGAGLKGRTRDLREVLKTLGPTSAQVRRITSLLAERRRELPKLVHNLAVISKASAKSDTELAQVVDAGNATLEALASSSAPLQRSLDLLPGTLTAARATIERTPRFSASVKRALDGIDPALEALPATLRGTPGAARGLVPLPAKDLTTFIDGIAPLTKTVRPTVRDIGAAQKPLETAFKSLGRTTNALAYQESKERKNYLYWLAWFFHNANSAVSTEDAHGAVIRGFAMLSCSTFAISPQVTAVLDALLGTAGTCPPP